MEQYIQLLKDIQEKGTYKPAARENMPGTQSLFGAQLRFNLQDGFPLLTTKKMFWKGVVIELLWFLKGDTNIKYLIDNGVNIWNEDSYSYYKKLCVQWHEDPVSFEIFKESVGISHAKFDFYTYGDCGKQYGEQWRNFGSLPTYQIQPKSKVKRNGEGSSESKLKGTWDNMMARCYAISAAGYKYYGGKGVYVSDEWHTFRTFENDVIDLDGWGEKWQNWDEWQLDKDFSGDGFCYSKETCKWVDKITNTSSSKEVFIFEKEGKLFETNNLRKFAREQNITHGNLSRVINGKRPNAYGFTLHGIESKFDGLDQIAELIKGLKESPQGRRHIVTAWNPKDLDNLALHPCHALFQFNCRPLGYTERMELALKMGAYSSKKPTVAQGHIGKPYKFDTYMVNEDKMKELNITKQDLIDGGAENYMDACGIPRYYLDCQLYQRSADVFLGVPFNIASYVLLTEIIAKICNMIPGEFIHTFGDVHIYDNHKEAVEEQLKREPGKLPKLKIMFKDLDKLSFEQIEEVFEKSNEDDYQLVDYNPQPSIKAELSTGLKK